ncbi:HAD-like domain protein [Tanacetum coccineum]
MEQVTVSAPVQERLDTEVDKAVGVDAKLTELKKPKKHKRPRSRRKLLAKGEDTDNPNTSVVGAIASADQEMIVLPPTANGDAPDVTTASRDICSPAVTAGGKSLISSTNALDKTVSHDILSAATTVDKQMTVLSSAPVQECLVMETDKDEVAAKLTKSQKRNLKKKAKKDLESLVKREGTENSGSLGVISSVDLKMMVLSPAATVDEKSSIPSTNATDQIASGDTLSTKVHEAVSGETGSGKTVTDSTPSKKRKRNQTAKKAVAGDVLSAKVDEVVSGETVLGKTVTDDTTPKKKKKKKNKKKKKVAGDILSAEVDEIVSGETVPDKAVTDNTTPKNKNEKVAGDVLCAKCNEVVSGETVPSKTETNNTTPKKKKKNKKKKKLKTVAGDILSTCENVQGKGNAIEGLNATDITESISGEMVSGKTALPDVKMVSQEEHTEAANVKKGSSATPNLNVNGAVNSSLTIGEILTTQNLQNLKADSGVTGSGTNAADTTASKKRKRGKNKKKSPLSGDILSTCENIQDKVNEIDGLRTTKVPDTKVTNKTELSDITNHNVAGKKGPEVAKSEIDASNRTSKQKTKKQKVDVNPSENKEISQATQGKKLIIFDVNGMLADIVCPRPKDVEADKYYHGKAVFKRPYLDDFLSFCFENFNVGIWSSRMKKNLDPVVDCLFGDLKKKLLFIWDASHCRNSGMRTLEDRYKCIVFKELRKVWEKNCSSWVKGTFNESNTLLLDDSPYKALLNPKHTGIFPISYKYTDTNDDYLGPTGALRVYLEGFAAADDGRTYVEQNPFGEDVEEENPKSKDDVVSSEQNGKQSEDPFNIYSLLNKDKMKNNKEASTKESLEYPPGFTPRENDVENVEMDNQKDNCDGEFRNVNNISDEVNSNSSECFVQVLCS